MTPNQRLDQLGKDLSERFADKGCVLTQELAELTLRVPKEHWPEVAVMLRDDANFAFEQAIDVCGVDYIGYGEDEWITSDASSSGFGRGQVRQRNVEESGTDRFAVVYHLLSMTLNNRLRVKVFLDSDDPRIDSMVSVWSGVDWFEREAFDLYGILFEGHHDLRRILTDYGFIGHPMRKDFPLTGNVEMRYDEETKRVIYQPVSIEQRPQVPKVIRLEAVATSGDSADA